MNHKKNNIPKASVTPQPNTEKGSIEKESLSLSQEGNAVKNPDVKKDILERLNLQLLITILTTTLAMWWYLYNRILNFTGLEPLNEQMCYIFVHYIDTLTFLWCLCLTAIKSYQMANSKDLDTWLYNIFKMFLETWYVILIVCFLAIIFSKSFPFEWLFFAVFIMLWLSFKMYDIKYKRRYIAGLWAVLILGFFVFVPSMTAIFKSVEIETDKPFYSFSDKVHITVSVKGYACRHKLVGLGEEYKDAKYYSDKGLIVMQATQIKNNEVAIATISPLPGNYFCYTFEKMFGKEIKYKEIDPNDIEAIKHYCILTPVNVFVKP